MSAPLGQFAEEVASTLLAIGRAYGGLQVMHRRLRAPDLLRAQKLLDDAHAIVAAHWHQRNDTEQKIAVGALWRRK